MSDLDLELVQRFTGQVRVRSVAVAQQDLNAAAMALRGDVTAHQAAVEARRLADLKLRSARTRLAISRLPQKLRTDPWVIAAATASVLGLLMGTFSIFALRAPLPVVVLTTLSIPVLIFAFTPWFFNNLQQQGDDVERLTYDRAAAAEAEQATASVRELSQQRQDSLKKLYDGLVQAREFPLERLLSTDLQSMSGTQFEEHLAEIFRFLDYHVRQTGQTGDQGVDLIIWRGNIRVAVQAKCYGSSVGNDAVQQVYSGMAFHKCDRCAVITTSIFTTSAKALARATGCVLIEGSQLPNLIRGQIDVAPAVHN